MNYECGTMAVPAVPGAGKTFIVTNLVAKLLEENKNEKGKILILIYMNSAANNFKGRIKKILEEKGIESTNDFFNTSGFAKSFSIFIFQVLLPISTQIWIFLSILFAIYE